MKKQAAINIFCAIAIVAGIIIMVTDPFGAGTATQYGVNAVCIFAIGLSIAKSSWLKELHPEDF